MSASRLSLLRSWLSLTEAAQYVEHSIGEPVKVHDLLRFALDGHLTLSINLQSPRTARRVVITQKTMGEVINRIEVFVERNRGIYTGESFSFGRYIDFAEPESTELITLSGVYDTPLLGIEKIFAESQYCKALDLPLPSRAQDVLRGVIIDCGVNGLFQIQEFINADRELSILHKMANASHEKDHPFTVQLIEKFKNLRTIKKWDVNAFERYIPCPDFPDDAYFVARMSNINALITSLNNATGNATPKQSQKTQNAQARFIKGLLMVCYGEDVANSPRKHIDGKTAQIRNDLESKGLDCPSGVTVENWLSGID
ncbi:hypothetical protein JRK10_002346 [Salmonella enterica]|nr:hypothetical protein [Salmonella enterica subsp. enterica serovar Duisburg]EAS2902105.1 hypothetical protein [Salmonella enterica]EIE2767494.1 hypothetical protein [Salmonella enterica subsp. enterica serovar Rubislaw]OIN15285.1 hypothetical protein AO411_2022995 [Salmonella enterica subsp. enterica serovar Sarajane]EAX8252974.1 hypothetical protein [Salmonella enterica]